jgi:hypothetical protein
MRARRDATGRVHRRQTTKPQPVATRDWTGGGSLPPPVTPVLFWLWDWDAPDPAPPMSTPSDPDTPPAIPRRVIWIPRAVDQATAQR